MPDRSAGEINWLLEEMLPVHVDLDDGSPREYVCLIVQEGDNGQNKRMKLEAMLWRGDEVAAAFCLLPPSGCLSVIPRMICPDAHVPKTARLTSLRDFVLFFAVFKG